MHASKMFLKEMITPILLCIFNPKLNKSRYLLRFCHSDTKSFQNSEFLHNFWGGLMFAFFFTWVRLIYVYLYYPGVDLCKLPGTYLQNSEFHKIWWDEIYLQRYSIWERNLGKTQNFDSMCPPSHFFFAKPQNLANTFLLVSTQIHFQIRVVYRYTLLYQNFGKTQSFEHMYRTTSPYHLFVKIQNFAVCPLVSLFSPIHFCKKSKFSKYFSAPPNL